MLDEAEDLHRKLGLPGGLRRVLHLQGQQAAAVGDLDRGRRMLRESADLSLDADDRFSAASSLHSLGDLDLDAGDTEAAEGTTATPFACPGTRGLIGSSATPSPGSPRGLPRAETRASRASVGLRRGLRRAAPLHVAAAWPLRGAVRSGRRCSSRAVRRRPAARRRRGGGDCTRLTHHRRAPEGRVTLLFTDIEGSTRLLDELGDDYAGLLAAHNRVMRSAIAEHRGVVVDTGGDSFFVVFERVRRRLGRGRGAGWPERSRCPVRMGIHSGEPSVSDDEYVGMDVHRAARVMAAGHGGQVLLTQPTVDMLEGAFELRDLGEHRLKDLTVPLRLYQLGTGQFPPLRSLDQARLPIDLDPLVGRKRELGDLVRRLSRDRARVVTITGPGGVGKTRLATAAAQELVESYTDGVTFVDLAPIRDPEVVLPTIADALAIEGDLASQIGTGQHLLVLDNVEQVVDAAPDIAGLWLPRRASPCSRRAASPCGSQASTSFGSARSPKHPPSSCSGSARRLRGTTSRPTIDSSPESANGSTTCPSLSSSLQHG